MTGLPCTLIRNLWTSKCVARKVVISANASTVYTMRAVWYLCRLRSTAALPAIVRRTRQARASEEAIPNKRPIPVVVLDGVGPSVTSIAYCNLSLTTPCFHHGVSCAST